MALEFHVVINELNLTDYNFKSNFTSVVQIHSLKRNHVERPVFKKVLCLFPPQNSSLILLSMSSDIYLQIIGLSCYVFMHQNITFWIPLIKTETLASSCKPRVLQSVLQVGFGQVSHQCCCVSMWNQVELRSRVWALYCLKQVFTLSQKLLCLKLT